LAVAKQEIDPERPRRSHLAFRLLSRRRQTAEVVADSRYCYAVDIGLRTENTCVLRVDSDITHALCTCVCLHMC